MAEWKTPDVTRSRKSVELQVRLLPFPFSTEWRLTQELARETTAKNFVRGDKTTP